MNPRNRLLAIGALISLGVAFLLSDAASACAVCSAREDAQRVAFIATTVFLSALPVALVFGVAWWLRKQVRERDARVRRARAGLGPARSTQLES